MILERKFTEEEIEDLLSNESVYDEDGNELFVVVQKELYDHDTEKNSTTFDIVIKDCSTEKFYKTRLSESQWYLQAEYNCKADWFEVNRVQVTTWRYE